MSPDAGCVDADADGVSTCAGDCNDADPLAAPGAVELCGDGVDNDCDTMTDEGCAGGLGTFVSATTGNDANPGTRAMPVQTIARGMANAMTLGLPQRVIVAEGTYAEKVTMVEGIDLVGGFQCDATSCTWARDPATHVATIQDTDFEGVVARAGVTRGTRLDGFRVIGRSGTASSPGGAAITLAGGSPTIVANDVVGGNVAGGGFRADRSIGILLLATTDPSGALIEGNTVTGGTSTNLSCALMIDASGAGTSSLATVQRNVLRGGTGVRSVGLTSWSAAVGTVVTQNTILAGDSTGGVSYGIEVGGRLTIDANLINTDPARTGTCVGSTRWCAGIASESSTTVITNNVVYGPRGDRSAAIYLGEFEVPAGSVVINGNLLDGGGSGLGTVASQSAAVVVTIGTCSACGFRGFVGRIRNDILLGGANAQRFGILEDPSVGRAMRPELIENNLFFFSPMSGRTDILYRQTSSAGTHTDHTSVASINTLTSPPAAANIAGDPLVNPTWHLTVGSPCIDTGTAMEAPATDFDGESRPRGAAIDIGPDES